MVPLTIEFVILLKIKLVRKMQMQCVDCDSERSGPSGSRPV